MTENEEIIVNLLKRWTYFSKNLLPKNKQSLRILLRGLAVLNEDEKKLLWDVYYLKNNDVEFLREFHGLGLLEFQEKQKAILKKMEEPILEAIEEEQKKENELTKHEDERFKQFEAKKEDVKAYLRQMQSFYMEIEHLNEERKLANYSAFDSEFDMKFERLIERKKKIETQIELIPNMKERLVIRYRYGLNKTWKEVGKFLGVTQRAAHHIHDRALRSFYKILEKEKPNESTQQRNEPKYQENEPKYQENEPSFMDRELRARQERFHKRTESDKSDNERE